MERDRVSGKDFTFGVLLGEGAYARVLKATLKRDTSLHEAGTEFAVKILDKAHVRRYQKQQYVLVERKVMTMLRHPNIVRLDYTFQDEHSLYFVMELALGGELRTQIQRLKKLSLDVTRFYAAETVSALEHIHRTGIIHRDLKPENILLHENGHIKITDFGTAKICAEHQAGRRGSFVGTAEYVSPELLNDQGASMSSDMWALGCIIYQMLVGRPPFRAESEYLTFQQILKLNYSFPDDFPQSAKDIIKKLLILDPAERLGSSENATLDEAYHCLKQHPFFNGIVWEGLVDAVPPQIQMPDFDEPTSATESKHGLTSLSESSDDELLLAQRVEQPRLSAVVRSKDTSAWQKFLLPNEDVVFSSLVLKKGHKGFFNKKKRQLVLTSFPRFLYFDPSEMKLKGEIPWSSSLRVDRKDTQAFRIITPKRTYYLKGLTSSAFEWEQAIDSVIQQQQERA